jgi:hypothetical protein
MLRRPCSTSCTVKLDHSSTQGHQHHPAGGPEYSVPYFISDSRGRGTPQSRPAKQYCRPGTPAIPGLVAMQPMGTSPRTQIAYHGRQCGWFGQGVRHTFSAGAPILRLSDIILRWYEFKGHRGNIRSVVDGRNYFSKQIRSAQIKGRLTDPIRGLLPPALGQDGRAEHLPGASPASWFSTGRWP